MNDIFYNGDIRLENLKVELQKALALLDENKEESNAQVKAILTSIVDQLDFVPEPYDPEYGDYRICECGHDYYRHFDTYEQMSPVGCKYCGYKCDGFEEGKPTECAHCDVPIYQERDRIGYGHEWRHMVNSEDPELTEKCCKANESHDAEPKEYIR